MPKNGYIKLYRSLLDWEWYDDTVTKCLFLHLLLTVNAYDEDWKGIVIKRGSRVSSYTKLSEELHFTIKQNSDRDTTLRTDRRSGKDGISKIYCIYGHKLRCLPDQRAGKRASKGHATGQARGRQRATK